MGRFDEIFGEKREVKPEPSTNILGGSYQCQSCDEIVYGANYHPESGDLIWKCSMNHTSRISGFYV